MTTAFSPLLLQFMQESRDGLQEIASRLLALERQPADPELMESLFRVVHTLKGNCGLFEFPEMFRVLHAAEDLMSAVRDGQVAYDREMADLLLEAMDFVARQFDDIELAGQPDPAQAAPCAELVARLRQRCGMQLAKGGAQDAHQASQRAAEEAARSRMAEALGRVPASLRMAWADAARNGETLLWVEYTPEPECFFKGEDPLRLATQMPGVLWRRVLPGSAWPALAELDAYRANLVFQAVTTADRSLLDDHFRYVPGQFWITALPATAIEVKDQTRANDALMIVQTQNDALWALEGAPWVPGHLKAAVTTIANCMRAIGRVDVLPALEACAEEALALSSVAPVVAWIEQHAQVQSVAEMSADADVQEEMIAAEIAAPATVAAAAAPATAAIAPATAEGEAPVNFGRRAEDSNGARVLKVEQEKVDRLMNLIGEMVVARNGLPYLASRAENQYGERELGRDIRAQHAVINRIVEEMQDAIMQVRMMPVSFVFQRFPRLVRDIARKLGKEVQLLLEGETTEADKNVIEALADPLVHLVRNALDHGMETPEERRAAGKPATGKLVMSARQEADCVVIEIADDGRGIDPAVIRRKAYARGLVDEAALERMSDREAVNLVFLPGFSTAEAVTDLSGRGVGMDAVRTAIERLHGSVQLESKAGQGTRLQLSLPLSMAVTNVMIVQSGGVQYGLPMEAVVETVRVPAADVHRIKQHNAAVLRGRIVPLLELNSLLGLDTPQRCNEHDEWATLILRVHGQYLGLVIDDFREVVEVILKPLSGVLAGLTAYAGSALLGDGSVLMVLNPKELLK
ncbi:chemotaxis protein CheA [Herbaspirillum huttiense]|uniref:Chemotaxis protein CheA n=1 Tax=Herbaspirillum huttiense TaxID=863372 RepID=A0AAJ2LP97_9BURK|nr:chemotaxis protein CheA [Herbaspirillum huttiense]MDR9834512.1 chemotaxis protein CheA [Herbaspirillum huttiense]